MFNKSLLAVLCLVLLPPAALFAEASERILFEKNSLYQYISVVEDTGKKERYIVNTKRDYNQGGISTEEPDSLLFEYTRIAFLSLAFLEREPRSVLFVGLGAGSMPRYFNRHYPEVDVDVVELDPDMLGAAREFFYFEEKPRMKVHISDGRMFIKRTKKKYDAIFLDAYQNDYIPFHLTTVEFLREVQGRLNEGGVVASNIVSASRNKFFDSMIETYTQVFPHLYIFRGKGALNYIFVAQGGEKRKRKSSVARRAEEIQEARKFDYNMPSIVWPAYAYYKDYKWSGKVLTDDFAPANLYRHMK